MGYAIVRRESSDRVYFDVKMVITGHMREGHVCFVPRMKKNSWDWLRAPAIFNARRRVDEFGALDCFSESYEETLEHLLDPNLPSRVLARVCRCMPQLAIKNPSFPLLAMVDPILGEQTIQAVSRLRQAEGIDPNGPLVEWPEKRLDINTFKFPWELGMRLGLNVRDADPILLTFFIKTDCDHPEYKSEDDNHAIFMVNTETMDSERVCSVPVGFHKTVVAEMCPFFRDTRRWWDNYFIFEHIPNCCFDPCYEADLAAMLSPDITNEDMRRISTICYSIAIKNPLYPLWSLSNMKDASVREQKYEDARRQCLILGIPEWFIEWPEKRPDITTFKFPWE